MNYRRCSAFSAILLLAALEAHGAPFDAADGQWLCLPDAPHWPQILVDFEENAYRRCDQNTCTSYDIAAFEPGRETVTVVFGAGARFTVRRDGDAYLETIRIGANESHTRGACTLRDSDEPYTPETVLERP